MDDENYQKDTAGQETTSHLGPQELVGMIIMHVDDLLGAGCPSSPRYNAEFPVLAAALKESRADVGCPQSPLHSGGQ